jgi:endo-1,4-beta-xylanase
MNFIAPTNRNHGRARGPHRADSSGSSGRKWPAYARSIGFWNLVFLLVLGACIFSMPACAQPTLKDAFNGIFRIGAALNPSQFTEENTKSAALIKTQFNTISPENVLKWESVHPKPDTFNFKPADRYVAFGEKNNMFIIGHTLVWHNQTPKWVFEDAKGQPITRDALLERLHEHISKVVGRYKGKIRGWDVVNEAVDDNGNLRRSGWYRIIGEDYLVKAYQFAHEADPSTELYYNDYDLEKETKRRGVIALVKKLQAAGIHIAAVGNQAHYKLESPSITQVDAVITDLSRLGLKVNITELDINVLPAPRQFSGAEVSQRFDPAKGLDPYPNGLPDELEQKLAKRYADLFSLFLKHRDVITRVTFWGVTDGDSWLNYFPVRGRTNYPLLFDRQGKPKPAYEAVIQTAHQTR